jgi:CBS domain-containing protein
MQAVEGPVLDSEKTVDQALAEVDHTKSEDLLVRLSPGGWNSVTTENLQKMAAEGKGATKLASLLPVQQLPFLHPDHPLETALRYVDRWRVVPVVSRADFRKLEGVVTQRHVLERYREFGEG